MKKFIKGQVVKTAKEIDEYGWKIPAGSNAKIVNVYGNGWYDISVDGKLVGHSVSDAILAKNATLSIRTSNPVVANAIAWKAKNSKGKIVKSSAGTYVLIRSDGSPMGEYSNEALAKRQLEK